MDKGHYYEREGNLVPPWTPGCLPSPTTILDIIRKYELEAYRLRVGEDKANELMTAAQERGTRVHKACEEWLLTGKYFEAVRTSGMTEDEFSLLVGFTRWWKKTQPELIETELFLHSKQYNYAGRCDLICKIDGELWIIDIKTGANRPGHALQLRFYEQAYFELTGEHARMGVLGLTNENKQGYRKLKEYNEPLINALAHKAVFDWWRKQTPAEKPVRGADIWITKGPQD